MRRAALLSALLLAGCGTDADAPPSPVTDVAAPDVAPDVTAPPEDTGPEITITASAEMNPNNTLSAIVTVKTSVEATVHISYGADGVAHRLTDETSAGNEHTIVVVGMRAETLYTLTPVATLSNDVTAGPLVEFLTGELPPDTPELSVVSEGPEDVQPGFTFFGVGLLSEKEPSDKPLYIAVDDRGQVVWYYSDPTAPRSLGRQVTMLPSGNLLLAMKGEYRIVTLGGETVASISGGPAIGGPIHHDAIRLDDGWIVLSSEIKPLNVQLLGGEVDVKGDTILEVSDAGDIVWKWSAFDNMDTTRFPGGLAQKFNTKDKAFDWTHGNALTPHGDSLLLCARHQNWIVSVARASGEIEWRLGPEGDFQLQAGAWFYSQHAPEPGPDNTMLVYDNGNERPNTVVPYSRAVMYKLDYAAMTASQVWEYQTTEYTAFLGDANRLDNGNVLVVAGGVRLAGHDDVTARITEITVEDPPRTVWELTTTGNIYRAARLSSLRTPKP